MPDRTQSYYDLDDVQGSIGPGAYQTAATFTGYGESGGISYDVDADLHEYTVGANGHVAISKNNNELVVATITCMAGTALCRDLSLLAKQQYNAPTPAPVPYQMTDPNLGDTIREKGAWFGSLPGPDKEDIQSEREFGIILPHARPQITHATAITV